MGNSLVVWCVGPVKSAQRQADPHQLAIMVSTLEAAVGAHMNQYTTSHALSPTVLVLQSAPPNSAVAGVSGAHAVLHGLDSTAVAASFGCAAHLLQIHRKLKHALAHPDGGGPKALRVLAPTGVISSAAAAAGKVQQSQPARKSEDATATGDQQHDADKDSHVDISHDAEVLQHVNGQVQWLINILKLPWQLQSAETRAQPGRYAVYSAKFAVPVTIM